LDPITISFLIPCFKINLCSLGKTDGALAQVIDGVPLAQESITQNSQGTNRSREVHAHKGRDTASLDLEDVVVGANGKVVTTELEADVGKAVTDRAVDGVLAVEALLGANLLVQELGKIGGQGNQGCTSVQNDTSVLELSSLVAERDGVQVDLPVCLAAQGNLGNFSSVVVLVNSAKDNLGRLIAILAREVEGKDGLVDEALVDHLVEGRDDAVDGQSVEAHAQNTVETAESKGKTGLAGGLGKVLTLDLEVTNGESVLGDETLHATGAVADLEVGAVLLVRGRSGRIILLVQVASNAAARLAGNPKVGATSVENDLEVLGGITDGDFREVY
jgi:hypothetical protein